MASLQHQPIHQPILATAAAAAPAVRIHELDGLRGLLALFVVAYHMYGSLPLVQSTLWQYAPIFSQAWYAVDVFFLMSGFVMMHVYSGVFAAGSTVAAYGTFMWARVARLYPVHLLSMILMLVMVLATSRAGEFFALGGRYSAGAFAGSLLMLHAPWIDYRSWNYPSWSISAEWHAYLLFPLLVPVVLRLRRAMATIVALACVLVPFALYLQHVQPDQYPTNGVVVLARVLPLFLLGMLLFHFRSQRVLRSGLAALLIVLATLVLLSIDRWAPAAVLLAPALVLAAMSPNWLQAALRHDSLLLLGRISYSLYMTHALVERFISVAMGAASKYAHRDLAADPVVAFCAWGAGVIAAVCLGYLVCRWIEDPARHWLMKTGTAPAKAKQVPQA
ncbi:acyltransferase [Herbaspirillum sp. YR522]|uniref:acyltransferase family protein n=1 Tax=Herbaspirillum sp. YR522 TaxID=1144342 RepID=UPI00026F7F45|nr:acyltransferase [Herbaspirillum sp. YR522]EJN08093.1 putative acyltransferase [Herbaspirillum sp. YR522]